MKYLVTGGAGFIGSHLVKELVDKGNQVTIVDNLSTGSIKNLVGIENKIDFLNVDILDKPKINEIISECDFVVHLAAALGVLTIVNKPLSSV